MSPEDIHFEREMTGLETMMWNIEKDPWLAPSGGAVVVYDRPLDFARFRHDIAYAVSEVVRLRQRVVEGRGPLVPPHWIVDREFDLDWHVRRMGAPGDGTLRELLKWVAQFGQDPFDRTRPLWQYVVVDGLADGQGALIGKIHHAITDGHGGMRMGEAYTSFEPNAPERPTVDIDAVIRSDPDEPEGLSVEARELLSDAIRLPIDLARKAVEVATHPDRLRAVGDQAADVLHMTTSLRTAGSPLWQHRSRRRHLEVLSVPFEAAHRAAGALGGTLNDFFMTGAVEAAYRYHQKFDAHPTLFHVTFVVSTRTDPSSGHNAFSAIPVALPGGTLDLRDRFRAIGGLLHQARAEVHGAGPMAVLASAANLLPTSLVAGLVRNNATHVDFATSNLPGYPVDSHVAGARTLHTFGFGPLAGTAFNLTQLSTKDYLDLAANIDPAAVTEPQLLRQSLEESYRDLIALV